MILRRLLNRATAVPVPSSPLKGVDTFLPFKLAEKFEITTDARIFRFELPEDQALGLPIGQHVLTRIKPTSSAEPLVRKYTPISAINDYGFFDLLIKVYFKETNPEFPAGGVVSQAIDELKIGDILEMSGPRGKITYNGGGLFLVDTDKGEKVEKRVKNLGMIAGGTGIAPFFQIIQYVAMTRGERMNMSLIYANRSEGGIMMRQELEEFVAEQKLHMYLVLDSAMDEWTGGRGYVSKEMIMDRMPPPGKDTLICHCGPRAMNQLVRGQLLELGYSEDMLLKF